MPVFTEEQSNKITNGLISAGLGTLEGTITLAALTARDAIGKSQEWLPGNLQDSITLGDGVGGVLVSIAGSVILINSFPKDEKNFGNVAINATEIGIKAAANTFILDIASNELAPNGLVLAPSIGVPLVGNILSRMFPKFAGDINTATWVYTIVSGLSLIGDKNPELGSVVGPAIIASLLSLGVGAFLRSQGITIEAIRNLNKERRKISDEEMEIIGRDILKLGIRYKSAIWQVTDNIEEADDRDNEIILTNRYREDLADIELEFVQRIFDLVAIARLTYKDKKVNLDEEKVRIGKQAVEQIFDYEKSIKANPLRKNGLTAEQLKQIKLDLADGLLALIPDELVTRVNENDYKYDYEDSEELDNFEN